MTSAQITAWGQELQHVHARLRHALALARESIEDGSTPEGPSRELLLFCTGFCSALEGHHRGEDSTLFVRLLELRPDLAPLVTELQADHSMLTHLIGAFQKALDSGDDADELLRHLDGIGAVMEMHFRYEERRLTEMLDGFGPLDLDATAALGPLAD